MHKKILSSEQQYWSQVALKDFIIGTLFNSVDEIHQFFYENLL